MYSINKLRILCMSDATDGGAEEVDPLSQAAGGVDTSFPLLAGDRILRMEISKVTHGPSKTDESRNVLTIKMKTQKEAALNDGKTAKPGFTCYKRISTSPSEKTAESEGRTNKDIARDLALVLKAVGKPDVSPRALMDNPSILEGQVVDVRVGVAPARGSFPESNTFSFVLPA